MDSSQDFGSLQSRISSSLVDVTRTAGQLSAEDLSFQRSLNSGLAGPLDRLSGRLLRCGQTLVQRAVTGSEVDPPRLEEQDDVENNWEGLVEVVDSLLERADIALDEYTGLVKRLSPGNREQVSGYPSGLVATLLNSSRPLCRNQSNTGREALCALLIYQSPSFNS